MNNNIIQLSSYTAPEVIESTRNEWVEYGADNNYYQFLIDRYSNSATNNAVINNICRLVFGKGLKATDSAIKPNEWAQLQSIIKEEDLKRIIFDLYALGQCALQVHYDKGHKNIIRAYHTPIQLLRPEKCNKDGDIVAYYYSDNENLHDLQRLDRLPRNHRQNTLCVRRPCAGKKTVCCWHGIIASKRRHQMDT